MGASLMPYLSDPDREQNIGYRPIPPDISTLQKKEEPSWGSTAEGKATIAGAEAGMKSGSVPGALTTAGLYNMIGAEKFTPMGGGLMVAGAVLGAAEKNAQIDYANKKMVADQQQAAQSAKTAGLYHMMTKSYNTVG